jgi:hypothetical protein
MAGPLCHNWPLKLPELIHPVNPTFFLYFRTNVALMWNFVEKLGRALIVDAFGGATCEQ